MLLFHGCNRMLKKSGRLVQMKLRFPAARDRKVLQDFCLQRRAKSFHLANTVLRCCRLELGERGDTEFLVELEYLVGSNTREGEQFKHAFRYFLAQLFEAWMRSGLMKLGDDVRNCIADAGNICERTCRDNAIQRLRESAKTVSRLEVRLRAVGIPSAEGSPLRIFPEEARDCLRVRLGHNPSQTGWPPDGSTPQVRHCRQARNAAFPRDLAPLNRVSGQVFLAGWAALIIWLSTGVFHSGSSRLA